jgi:hypothetical protein
MNSLAEILKRLGSLAQAPAPSFLAVVVSVDEEAKTAVVKAGGLDYYDVRLSSKEGEGDMLVIPAVNSSVLVSPIEGIPSMLSVLQFSKIEKVVFHGGKQGGMVKAQELAQEIDKIRALLEALQNAVSSWVPVPSDGGAALKSLLSALCLPLPLPSSQDLQNDKILQ